MRLAFIAILFSFMTAMESSEARWGEVKTIDVDHMQKDFSKKWYLGKAKELESLKSLFYFLSKSKTGKKLIGDLKKMAKREGRSVRELVLVGETSLTDTTLIRRFDADNPQEMRFETRSKVYVNKNLTLRDAILDLAHELTHLTTRKAFNPYEEDYNIKKFVQGTIEGKGGEVEAYLVECQVAFDLFGLKHQGKCSEIVSHKTGGLSHSKGKEHFYKMGEFFSDFSHSISKYGLERKDFIYTSPEEPMFISSAYGIPYPIAAVKEYEVIMTKVCENDKKRLSYLRNSRRIASVQHYKQLQKSLQKRCVHFL